MSSFTKTICLSLVLLLASPLLAETYTFDGKHSKVGFQIGHFTGKAKGQFRDFEGTLEFDERSPEKSRVELVIQVDSVDTNSKKRDRHLLEEDYFDEKKFSTITFKSKSFKKRGKRFVVAGPLTIKGVSKNITLQVKLARRQAQWAIGGEALTFESEYELNRLDYGVDGGQPVVGKQVDIELEIKAFQKQ